MGNFKIGVAGTNINSFIDIFPDYRYSFPETKNQIDHRTLSGKLFSYKFFTFNRFEVPLSWVNSDNRLLVNSWWNDNSNLVYFENYPDTSSGAGFEVRITNPEEPFPSYNRMYEYQFYAGSVVLEEYS